MQALSQGATAGPCLGTPGSGGGSRAILLADRMTKLPHDGCSLLEAREHRASCPRVFILSPAAGQEAQVAMAGACGAV